MKITHDTANTYVKIENTVKFQALIRNEKQNNYDMRQVQIYDSVYLETAHSRDNFLDICKGKM